MVIANHKLTLFVIAITKIYGAVIVTSFHLNRDFKRRIGSQLGNKGNFVTTPATSYRKRPTRCVGLIATVRIAPLIVGLIFVSG